MFDAAKLWRERLGIASKEIGRYSRYIFNGHIVIVLVFLLGTASYYYQQWVQTLQGDFPVALLMGLVIGALVTYSPVYTFLLDPDKIFLLPLEDKLAPYFRRSIILSWLVGIYLTTIGLAVLMPIYAQVTGNGFSQFFSFLVIVAILKIWNLVIRWKVLHHVEKSTHLVDSIIRYILNAAFLFLLFNQANIVYVGVTALLLLGLYATSNIQAKSKGLKWETLIHLEEKRMMAFYRLANLFTDVPKLRDQVKRRRYLDFVVNRLPYQQSATYLHLFLQTFVRGGDYLGLWVRLSVIGGVMLYFVTFGYGQILFVVLFLYLTGFQLLPLWNHHQNKLWLQIYPAGEESKKSSFQSILFRALCIQSVLLSFALLLKMEWLVALGAIVVGCVFSYLYVYVYMSKKLT